MLNLPAFYPSHAAREAYAEYRRAFTRGSGGARGAVAKMVASVMSF